MHNLADIVFHKECLYFRILCYISDHKKSGKPKNIIDNNEFDRVIQINRVQTFPPLIITFINGNLLFIIVYYPMIIT